MEMEFATLVAVGLLLLLLVGWVARRVHQWVQEWGVDISGGVRLPPGEMGFPLIGNMWAFLRAYKWGQPDSFMGSFIQRYGKTGIYKGYMFGGPTIHVTSPEACRRILMDDEHFVLGWPKAAMALMGRKSFIGISQEEHKWLRKLTAAPINGYEALNTYLQYIEFCVISALEKWSVMGEFEFLTELRRLTFRIIMKIFLGKESDVITEALERVYTELNYGIRAMAINIPGFAFHKALKARKKLVEVLQAVLDERRALEGRDTSRRSKDMMDNLLEVKDENGRKLTDEEIIDVLIMYLNAGHESSGHITMWATVFLQDNPDIFKRAKEEQENVRKTMPPMQKGLTLKEIRKMEYLSKLIDETLRLVNISFVSFRKATANVTINGYLVPKDWRIMLWYRSVHMDPEVYTDPKKFNPSRWDGPPPKAGTFLPFGLGSHLCPGNELAKLEISVFLYHFLLKYKLERVNPKCKVRYLPHPRPVDNCLARLVKLGD
ncbi:ent-kaurenoic acid oxidase-like [Carex rostrata]